MNKVNFDSIKTERSWGYFRVLHEPRANVKVKELTVNPNCTLSMQRHSQRKELWFVDEGIASVYTLVEGKKVLKSTLYEFDTIPIDYQEWHMLSNETNKPLKIIEIQYGLDCVEEDIERIVL